MYLFPYKFYVFIASDKLIIVVITEDIFCNFLHQNMTPPGGGVVSAPVLDSRGLGLESYWKWNLAHD